jgi:hypothetical protein
MDCGTMPSGRLTKFLSSEAVNPFTANSRHGSDPTQDLGWVMSRRSAQSKGRPAYLDKLTKTSGGMLSLGFVG